jgi:hypothetical protein
MEAQFANHRNPEFWIAKIRRNVERDAGSLEEEFGVPRRPARGLARVSDRLFNADLPLQRNRLQAQLTRLIATIFEEIAD